ncbi:hypothetical protein ILUMI_23358 [Ignelater luminosus]|uniref:Peptidase S1 domain-containing protein n=1 Tax=Ignelater luminosus TaxID=2038154 RepID=A0A8K0CC81_IGNLU|nr:hypothetical protein ILUMI_23358 [Ignelater luminosus]
MVLLVTIFFILFGLTKAQEHSPCPDVLVYESRQDQENVWYGQILLSSPQPLSGVWIRILLDHRAELLGNSFGDASTEDNKDFLIKNKNYQLEANRDPVRIRFFVKYNAGGVIPRVKSIKLNGRPVCTTSSTETATTTERWYISNTKVTEPSRPVIQPTPSIIDSGNNDEEFYGGDLSPSRIKIIPTISSSIQGESCGTVKIPARPLITYGQSTTEGEWPWHAALYRSKGLDLQYICGGSLISPKHIITAAHCVTKPKTGVPVNPELLTVYLGKYNLIKPSSNVQDKTVKRITAHPEYNATYFHNDLAVLELDSPVQISDFVRSVCLWEEDSNLNSVVEKLGTVVGWGFDQTGTVTENLMQAKMPVVSTETCIFSNRDFFSRFTSTKTFCAGFRNGTSACTGDSGGGMVFPKTGTSGQNSVWQLRGVISLSAALQNANVVCDTSNYIVFTDVAKYLDWIRRAMRTS